MAPTLPRTSALALALGLALAGCRSSPFQEDSQKRLREAVIDAAERELRDALAQPARVTTTREDLVAQLGIRPEFMPELERMAGPRSYDAGTLALGDDLLGQPTRTVTVSLERALRTAAEHNLAVQFARLGPAVNEAQVQAAEAAFDWTLFGTGTWNNTNSPQPTSNNTITSSAVESIATSMGLRRSLVGGGRLTTQFDNTYTDTNTPGVTSTPNPSVSTAFLIQWDQPLLRGAGSEVTQAEIRVARNAERNAVQTLRRDLIRVLSDTEKTYWDLARSVHDVLIIQRLLERGVEVRRQLEQRLPLDANQAQIASARARVEQRRADLDRARRQVRVLSDRLKQLMNDPQMPVGSEIVILPADRPVDQPIRFSLAESLRQAVAYRPEVQQAALAIDDASIRLTVARNARLPDLSLRLQVRWSSLDEDIGTTAGHLFQGTFIDYLAGLSFEQAIGNRRANADARKRFLERSQTVIAYRNAVQTVAGDVKAALNRVILNYNLIAQTASARYAAAEVLRVLQVEKDFRQGYSVERLDLELNRQEALAAAEREEMQALTEYNQSLADLFQAMGTTLERNNIVLRVPTADETWTEWQSLRWRE